MSDKLDFIKYLISTLAAASTKLLAATPANADTAGRLNQIVRTADDNVSDGHWARIAPLYEPLAPKLELAVMHVNADIIAGREARACSYILRAACGRSAELTTILPSQLAVCTENLIRV